MNSFCAIGNEAPTRFCTCRGRTTVLCDKCVPTHEKQAYGELHDYNPIAYYEACCSLGPDEFRRRKTQVLTGSSFVQRLQELEQTQYLEARKNAEDLLKTYLSWLDYLHSCFEALANKFNQEKQCPLYYAQPNLSKFTYAVFEQGMSSVPSASSLVETHSIDTFQNEINAMQARLSESCGPQRDFEDYFVDLIKAGTAAPMNSSSMPAYDQYSVPVVQSTPHYQTQAGIPVPNPGRFRPFVPFSRGRLLAKWMCDTTDLDRVRLGSKIDYSNVTVSVVLPDGNLFSCAGREPYDQRAFILNSTTGEDTQLPNMKKSRGNPGLAYINGVAFVFGGFVPGGDAELKSAEKFVFQQQQWTLLSSEMAHSRFQFTPFAYNRTVYIAGGWHTDSVEALDIPSERFSTLPLTLPKASAATCFVYNNQLVVLQDHQLIRWNLSSRANDADSRNVGSSVKDSTVGVQIVGTKAYYTFETNQKCDVHELDLQTWNLKEAASLSNSNSGGQQCPVS